MNDDSTTHSVNVEFGDPHNDQMAARAQEDMLHHVESVRSTLRQAGGDVAATMATAAVALDDAVDAMPRIRLASLLAAALIEIAQSDGGIAAEARGYQKAVDSLRDADRYRRWHETYNPAGPRTRLDAVHRDVAADYLDSMRDRPGGPWWKRERSDCLTDKP